MIILGVDPGEHGAIAIINSFSFRDTIVMPIADNSLYSIYAFLSDVRGGVVASRMKRIDNDLTKLLKIVGPGHPRKPLECGPDNPMEMFLEEPGIIRIPTSNNKDGALTGLHATRKVARSVGEWYGIGTALNISINCIPPVSWQSRLSCKTKGDKNVTKNLAKKIFPFLTSNVSLGRITHDTADALLIALYGYIQYVPKERWPMSVKENFK